MSVSPHRNSGPSLTSLQYTISTMVLVQHYHIPPELVEHIITFLWSDALLPTPLRVQLMTSSLLVSRVWAATFLHVSARDVHIPTTPFLQQFRMQMTRTSGCSYISNLLKNECLCLSRRTPNQLCKTLTVTARAWLGEEAWNLEVFFLLYGGAMPNVERVTSITWMSPEIWRRTDREWSETARRGPGMGIVGQVCTEGSSTSVQGRNT